MKYLQCFHPLWKTRTLETSICISGEELNGTKHHKTDELSICLSVLFILLQIVNTFETNWDAESNWNAFCSNIQWEQAFEVIQESNNSSQTILCITRHKVLCKIRRTEVWWCEVDHFVHLSEKSCYLFTLKYPQTCLHVTV